MTGCIYCCADDDVKLPANWDPMNDREQVKLESLHKGSDEYTVVEKDIMRTAGGYISDVIKVSLVRLRWCTCTYACACAYVRVCS